MKKRDPSPDIATPVEPDGTCKRQRMIDWGAEEDTALHRAILQFLYDNRAEVHRNVPELDRHRGHGASRITGKLTVVIGRLEKEWGVAVNKKTSKNKTKKEQ